MIAETYNTSGVPVDYQDRMAQRMTDREKWIRLANDWYGAAFKASRKQTIDEVLAIIDNDIDFYRQLGKPNNQHRDVINAFTDFREEVLALKGDVDGEAY